MPNLVGSEESPHLLLLWKAPKEPPPCCVTKVNLEVWRPMGLLAVKTQISITSFFHWDYIIMMLVHTTNRLIKKEPWIENIFAFHLKICYRTIYKYDVIWLFVYTSVHGMTFRRSKINHSVNMFQFFRAYSTLNYLKTF